jgi:hypothetical protein
MRRIQPDGELTFGKHDGCFISDPDVPTHYLEWMRKTIHVLTPEERFQLDRELARRALSGHSRAGNQSRTGSRSSNFATAKLPSGVTPDAILELISAGRQALAKRFHPDVGGDTEKMKTVNQAADFLERQVELIAG